MVAVSSTAEAKWSLIMGLVVVVGLIAGSVVVFGPKEQNKKVVVAGRSGFAVLLESQRVGR